MKTINLLIIEDPSEAEVALRQRLLEMGYNILGVLANPNKIIENPLLAQTDLVLMDLFLDEKYTGLNACRDITNFKGLPVIMMVGNENLKFNVFDEANAHSIMAKPFSDVALYYNLRSAVGFETKKNEYSTVTESYREHIFVKMDYKLHKLKVDDIIYIEASKDYVDIYLEKTKYRVNVTMHQMEQALPSDRFVRTHRSFIVNINYINYIKFPEIQLLQTAGVALIGGNYKKEVYQKINVL